MKLEITREYSPAPVPSHGGQALSVRWVLTLNDVEVGSYSERYPWTYDRSKIGDPPSIIALRDQIQMGVEKAGTYTHLEMEAALCVWEHLCDITVNTTEPDEEWFDYRQGIGSVELRHESITIGKWVLKVYDLLPEWYRDIGAYDWEIVPTIVGHLTPGEEHPDPQETARSILTSDAARKHYLQQANWFLNRDCSITFTSDAGLTEEEFFQYWFDPMVAPEEQAKRFAVKYDLARTR